VTLWRILFASAAWLYLAGVVTQVFLAGAGLFELTDWTAHTQLGWGLGSAPLLLLALSLLARPGRGTILLTAALALAAMVQPELAAARHEAPVIAALHPVNALLVFWLAWLVARRSAVPLIQVRRRAEGWTAEGRTAVSTSPTPRSAAPPTPRAG
jgi:hypothetical protein